MTQKAPWSATRTIALGTLVVGTLDIADALIYSAFRGVTPTRLFHAIASGLLGREAAAAGGLATAFLGAFLHYFIAFGIVTICYLASRKIPFLTRHPWIAGAIYGVLVYLFMNLVVIPLSAIGTIGIPKRTASIINGVLIHIFGIGIPSALFARAASPPAPRSEAALAA
jgi:hypothetical protein